VVSYSGSDFSRGMFDREDMFEGLPTTIEKFALNAGSSKQGKAWRASVGEN
jgi:hypothetical protein